MLKESCEPNGVELDIRNMAVDDPMMPVKELWDAMFQEHDAMLIHEKDHAFLEEVSKRERVPLMVIGKMSEKPADLMLLLDELSKKTFVYNNVPMVLKSPMLPADVTVMQALDRILRLLSVGSKRFFTSKVDRLVTSRLARPQYCGQLYLSLSDVAVFAQGPFSTTGCATAIEDVKSVINPVAMGHMTVGEVCTNRMWVAITDSQRVNAMELSMFSMSARMKHTRAGREEKACHDVRAAAPP